MLLQAMQGILVSNKTRKGFFMLKVRRGQSLLEYAILMVIIIAALLTLQTYIKRGLQGRLKSSADDIGEKYSMSSGANYSKVVTTTSNTRERVNGGTTESTQRAPSETVTNVSISTNTAGEQW